MIEDFSKKYASEIVPKLKEQWGYKSIMQVPKITKITLNMGVGAAAQDKKIMTNALEELALIAGQKAVMTKARKSISGFKIRQGWGIGCKVTLRAQRMMDFWERLIKIALPRVRDFRGYSVRGFDGRGNYSLGIKEQIVFLEIDYDKISQINGLDIAVTTNAKTDQEAYALLLAYGFPFRDKMKEGV